MFFIITLFIVSCLSGMTHLIFYAYDSITDVVFKLDTQIGVYFSSAVSVMYDIGISLMILKFLKKGFEVYVLWSDGDPDMEPLQLLINFIKAIAVAIGFRPVYNIFVDVLKEAIAKCVSEYNISQSVYDFGSLGLINGIILIIVFIMFVILYAKSIMLGINMLVLNIGMPIACTGLLDNDKGVFKNYFMVYVKTFLTVLIQVVLSKIGLYIAISSAGVGSLFSSNFDILKVFLGLACTIVALGTPKLLSEFLVPSAPGGGIMNKMYPAMYVGNFIKRLTR